VNVVGCGGLLHDLDVRWIQGYTKKIGTCDTFYAKIWDMYERMKFVRRWGVTHLLMESDSKVLIHISTWRYNFSGATSIHIDLLIIVLCTFFFMF
jgi:hypothetical protein